MWKRLQIWIVLGLLCGLPLQVWAAGGGTVAVDGSDVLQLPEWSVDDVAAGGKLLLSDSPEEFTRTGILYSDVVEGHVRLFYHHVNGTPDNKRVAVVLENKADKPVQVTVYRKGLAGPGYDYLLVGKTAQQNYFGSKYFKKLELPANSAAILDEEAAGLIIKPKALVNAIYDFLATGPVQVKVMATNAHGNPLAENIKAEVLPADSSHLRGTFPNADRLKMPARVYDPSLGKQVLTLADGVTDPYVTGVDATDGRAVLNYGNYGVFYRIFIPTAAAEIKGIGFQLNPRGGAYAGALGLKINAQLQPPVGTPGDRTFLESPDTAANVIKINPDANLWVNFMPPGASNLPVKLIITPEN